jgi:hypothetical protein
MNTKDTKSNAYGLDSPLSPPAAGFVGTGAVDGEAAAACGYDCVVFQRRGSKGSIQLHMKLVILY